MLHKFSLQTGAMPTIPLPKDEDIFSKHGELFKKRRRGVDIEMFLQKCNIVTM
jgi:hypothetical protein